MAMSSATLKAELVALNLYEDEGDAIAGWSAAFKTYFLDAACNGIPVTPAALVPCEAAMKGAMIGLSLTGAVAIQAGIVAFWGALIPAVAFPPAISLIPPPALAGISTALIPVFLASTTGKLGTDPAMEAISTVIHANNLGGTAAFIGPPPLVAPIL